MSYKTVYFFLTNNPKASPDPNHHPEMSFHSFKNSAILKSVVSQEKKARKEKMGKATFTTFKLMMNQKSQILSLLSFH